MALKQDSDVLRIGGHEVARGQKRFAWIEVARRADGSIIGIPFMAVHGARPGRVLCVHAGAHGDEFEGMAAVERVARALDPKKMTGTFIGIPCSNVPALEVGRRQGYLDGLDMNRVFPGSKHGYLTVKLAHALFEEVIPFADCLIDVHSAGTPLMAVSHVMYAKFGGEADPVSLKMAMAYGTPYLYGSAPFENVLRMEAIKLGVSTVTVEVGGEGRFREELVEVNLRGITNNLKLLGIIEGHLENIPQEFRLIEVGQDGEYVHCNAGGRLEPSVALSDEVREGQVLGWVKDPFGNVLEKVCAPHDGLLMGMRTIGFVQPGDWTYFVARIVGTVRWSETMAG